MRTDPIPNSGDQSLSSEPSFEAQKTEGMIGSAIFRSAGSFNHENQLVKYVSSTPGVLHISLGRGPNVNELALHFLPALDKNGNRHGGVMGLRYRRSGKSVDLYRPGRLGCVRLEKLSFERFDRAAQVARRTFPDLSWPAADSPETWTFDELESTWADECAARIARFTLLRVSVFNPLEPIHIQGWLHENSYRLALKLPRLRDLNPIADALAAKSHGDAVGVSEYGFDIVFPEHPEHREHRGNPGRLEVRCEQAEPTLAAEREHGWVGESVGLHQSSVDSRGLIHGDEPFWAESASSVGLNSVSEVLRELRAALGDEITMMVARATVGELDAWTSEASVPDLSVARRMRFALQMWFPLSYEVCDEDMRNYMMKGDPRLDGLSPVAAIAREGDWEVVAEVVGSYSMFYR